MDLSFEKGGSSWLSTVPILDHGFALHTLCLRYGWYPSNLPLRCTCDRHFSVEHALSCSHNDLPSIHHIELHDITPKLLSQVCHNVGTELSLEPITDEQLIHQTANREEGAWLDLTAENFGVMIDNVSVLT